MTPAQEHQEWGAVAEGEQEFHISGVGEESFQFLSTPLVLQVVEGKPLPEPGQRMLRSWLGVLQGWVSISKMLCPGVGVQL